MQHLDRGSSGCLVRPASPSSQPQRVCRKSPVGPSGLGGRGAVVTKHESEGAGEVVGQGTAALLLTGRQQEEQQKKEQEQQLQRQRHAASFPQERAGIPPPPLLSTLRTNTRQTVSDYEVQGPVGQEGMLDKLCDHRRGLSTAGRDAMVGLGCQSRIAMETNL